MSYTHSNQTEEGIMVNNDIYRLKKWETLAVSTFSPYVVFCLNFSSACKGPFLTGKAKNLRHSPAQGGVEGGFAFMKAFFTAPSP